MNTPDNRRPVRPRAPFDFEAPLPGERRDPVVDHEHLADTLAGPPRPQLARDAQGMTITDPVPPTVDEAIEERMTEARGAPPVSTTIAERTANTLEQYSSSVLENIRALKSRLEKLEMHFIEDAAQCKERISAHMRDGSRVRDIMQGIDAEITEFEKRRAEMLASHARGTR